MADAAGFIPILTARPVTGIISFWPGTPVVTVSTVIVTLHTLYNLIYRPPIPNLQLELTEDWFYLLLSVGIAQTDLWTSVFEIYRLFLQLVIYRTLEADVVQFYFSKESSNVGNVVMKIVGI